MEDIGCLKMFAVMAHKAHFTGHVFEEVALRARSPGPRFIRYRTILTEVNGMAIGAIEVLALGMIVSGLRWGNEEQYGD